jgi:hypothetical protein
LKLRTGVVLTRVQLGSFSAHRGPLNLLIGDQSASLMQLETGLSRVKFTFHTWSRATRRAADDLDLLRCELCFQRERLCHKPNIRDWSIRNRFHALTEQVRGLGRFGRREGGALASSRSFSSRANSVTLLWSFSTSICSHK